MEGRKEGNTCGLFSHSLHRDGDVYRVGVRISARTTAAPTHLPSITPTATKPVLLQLVFIKQRKRAVLRNSVSWQNFLAVVLACLTPGAL